MRADQVPLEGIDALVCDLDGVVYRGTSPIPGSIDALTRLQRRGLRVVYCTNNSAPTVEDYVRTLRAMGLDAAPEQIVTSAVVAAETLVARGLAGGRALVVGGDGVRAALAERGIDVTEEEARAGAVVVGRDKTFDFDSLHRASSAVRRGALFVATNDDATYPSEHGVEPGAGAIVAAVEIASGRRAEVVGKPHLPMMEAAKRRLAGAERVAVVGDRRETDLAGGRAMGWRTILVLSGVTRPAEAGGVEPRPDVVVDDLAALAEGRSAARQ